MINVSIAGIGGQGSVLAAKILAQAAEVKGWQVRSAETTGMAQRGGDVTSHVIMGNKGEDVVAPIPAKGSVDVIIALEPGEAARNLGLLRRGGLVVVAQSGMAPATADINAAPYDPAAVIEALRAQGVNLLAVDDVDLCKQVGSRKALNIIMLAVALAAADAGYDNALAGQVTIDDMKAVIPACVKPSFVEMNLGAIETVQKYVTNL